GRRLYPLDANRRQRTFWHWRLTPDVTCCNLSGRFALLHHVSKWYPSRGRKARPPRDFAGRSLYKVVESAGTKSCGSVSVPFEFGEGRGDVPHVIVIEQLPGVAVLEACGLGRFLQGLAFLDQFTHVGGDIGEITLLGMERRRQLHGVRTVAWDH